MGALVLRVLVNLIWTEKMWENVEEIKIFPTFYQYVINILPMNHLSPQQDVGKMMMWVWAEC